MDQRRKNLWVVVVGAFVLPAAGYGIWIRGFKPIDKWLIGVLSISFIAKLIWAWRQQRMSNKHLCFLCGIEWTPPPAPQKQFLCNDCSRFWLVERLRRLVGRFGQKSN
jgi:hypothetical protein